MNARSIPQLLCALVLSAGTASGAGSEGEARAHLEQARAAAGTDHAFIFGQLCQQPIQALNAAPPVGEVPAALPTIDTARTWYAEPVKVFDDLYFLGQTAFSVWALRTSEGIILIDSIFDYSVEDEVIGGLGKLGIDPKEIRYVIISHAHGDHSGGAGILQQKHGARVVMSAADWDLYEAGNDKVKAKRDIVATDGMEIRLGNGGVRVYLTPGHTKGTISSVMTVHDNGVPHVAALWGGTLFNFRDSPADPREARLKMYSESAARFGKVVSDAGADILLSNHTAYDGSTLKLPALASRRPGEANPYVIGNAVVQRYFTVAGQCALSALALGPQAPTPAPRRP